jgi:hypothetical protein
MFTEIESEKRRTEEDTIYPYKPKKVLSQNKIRVYNMANCIPLLRYTTTCKNAFSIGL